MKGETYLVDHHDGKQIADRGKEQSIQIVRRVVTDQDAEDVENDLADDEEEHTEANVKQRPAILKCVDYEHDLHDNVYQYEDAVEEVEDNEEADCVCGTKASPALEGQEGNGESDDEHSD